MSDYLRMADLHRELASVYDRINSLENQDELLTSIQQERLENLEEQVNVQKSIIVNLNNTLDTQQSTIKQLEQQISYLETKLEEYDQREEGFPIEF